MTHCSLKWYSDNFFRFFSHLLQIPCESHSYIPVSDLLNLTTLAEHRYLAGTNFMKGLLNIKVYFSFLALIPLFFLGFLASSTYLWNRSFFLILHSTTNYMLNYTIRHMCA